MDFLHPLYRLISTLLLYFFNVAVPVSVVIHCVSMREGWGTEA